MTENKRFIIANYPSDIEDTLNGKKYAMSSYYTHIEIICDLLNELHDENKKLKKQVEDLKFALRTELAHQRVEKKGEDFSYSCYDFEKKLDTW